MIGEKSQEIRQCERELQFAASESTETNVQKARVAK